MVGLEDIYEIINDICKLKISWNDWILKNNILTESVQRLSIIEKHLSTRSKSCCATKLKKKKIHRKDYKDPHEWVQGETPKISSLTPFIMACSCFKMSCGATCQNLRYLWNN